MASILIVDDQKLIVKGIKFSLEQDGMDVSVAHDGLEALDMAKENEYDLIVLDVMLPSLDGLSICQGVREFSSVPIIMLTAKSEDMDKIMGLEHGADDYITKPFNILELKARIKAILRRSAKRAQMQAAPHNKYTVRGLSVDPINRKTSIDGKSVNLTGKEFDLLELLIREPNKIYSRLELLKLIWGYGYAGDERTVDVHIRRLREKIEENPSDPRYLHTKWGVGYYLK